MPMTNSDDLAGRVFFLVMAGVVAVVVGIVVTQLAL